MSVSVSVLTRYQRWVGSMRAIVASTTGMASCVGEEHCLHSRSVSLRETVRRERLWTSANANPSTALQPAPDSCSAGTCDRVLTVLNSYVPVLTFWGIM